MFQLLSETNHTARRKLSICEECQTEISIGQKYTLTKSIYDGDFQSIKAHIECHEFAQSSDVFGVLEHDYGVRDFVINACSNDKFTAIDVLNLAAGKPVVLDRLLRTDWMKKHYTEYVSA